MSRVDGSRRAPPKPAPTDRVKEHVPLPPPPTFPAYPRSSSSSSDRRDQPQRQDDGFSLSAVDCERERYAFNTNRIGPAYEQEVATSANRCKKNCAVDEDCVAWVFVTEQSLCKRMRDPGVRVVDSCCVSGIKC